MNARRIGQIAFAGLGVLLVSTPAFAQEGGGLDFIEMFEQMGPMAMAIAAVLFIMSFWSVGVAIERIYTFSQAKKQSKMYAPLVAKHLKDGRLKEAIPLSSSKDYRYSHLAKVVLAGLQEYQFQQDTAGGATLNRDDLLDTVRRSIQRATALTSNDLKKGVSSLATIGATAPFVGLLGTVVGVINAFVGIASTGLGRHRRGVGRYRRSAGRDRARAVRGHPGGVVLQLPDRPPRVLQRRDGQLVVGDGRLLHPEDVLGRSAAVAVLSRGECTMAMDVGGAKGGVKSDINVTPLVDVMLVLLIIMMIIAPLLQKGVDVRLPTATNSADKPETQDQTVVGVTADGRFWVNGVQVPDADVRRRVNDILEGKKDRIVLIKADEDAPYGRVMEAMDALRAAGIEDMGLITERKAQAGGN